MAARKPRQNGERSPLEIPDRELIFDTARSGGPGGQNVNKVETKVRVVFNYWGSAVLSQKQKLTLSRDTNIARYCNPHGHIVVTSQQHRSQGMNRAAAVEKLLKLIRVALMPKVVRLETKTPRSSKQERQKRKIHRSRKKSLRRHPREQD